MEVLSFLNDSEINWNAWRFNKRTILKILNFPYRYCGNKMAYLIQMFALSKYSFRSVMTSSYSQLRIKKKYFWRVLNLQHA
jgi:hypothetical protein